MFKCIKMYYLMILTPETNQKVNKLQKDNVFKYKQ